MESVHDRVSVENGECRREKWSLQWWVANKTAKRTSGTTVDLMSSAALLQNNPSICELKVSKIKGKFIILLELIYIPLLFVNRARMSQCSIM